jgi:pyruvate,orthophosphate dikinase
MDRTTPNDIGCIAASRGVLTREGGMTSHAAINSRRMAKPCVTGCETLLIDRESQQVRIGSLVFGPDDTLSIDGYTGEVFLGAVDIIAPEDGEALADSPAPDMQAYLATYEAWKKG